MSRLLAISIVAWAAVTVAALAVPIPREAERAFPVAGTTWTLTDSGGSTYTVTFEVGGVFAYSSTTGSYRNGTWKQEGRKITFETNRHYRDFEGTITGRTMSGKSWNVTGIKWTWKAEKKP